MLTNLLALYDEKSVRYLHGLIAFTEAKGITEVSPEGDTHIPVDVVNRAALYQSGTSVIIIPLNDIIALNPYFVDNSVVRFTYRASFSDEVKEKVKTGELIPGSGDWSSIIPTFVGISFLEELKASQLEEYINNLIAVNDFTVENIISFLDPSKSVDVPIQTSTITSPLTFDSLKATASRNFYPRGAIKGHKYYAALIQQAPPEYRGKWSSIKVYQEGGLIEWQDDDKAGASFSIDRSLTGYAQINEGDAITTYQRIRFGFWALRVPTMIKFEIYFFTDDCPIDYFAIAMCSQDEAKARNVPDDRFISLVGDSPVGVMHNQMMIYDGQRANDYATTGNTLTQADTKYLYEGKTTGRTQKPTIQRISHVWQTAIVKPWYENLTYRRRMAITHLVIKAKVNKGGGNPALWINNLVLTDTD